ncbi:hypothetical protein HYV85_03075 [Candidatus Woesearchaeota archaeon]|nr:hypothetical protein [Candidatus Woesearchaeota archaeon]
MAGLFAGKRGVEGVTAIGFLIIGLLFAGIVSLGIVERAWSDIKGETLEKNYIARDIALLLDAVYASPGDLEYIYSMKGYKYVVEIKNSKVTVNKPGGKEQNAAFYAYFDGGVKEEDKLNARFFPIPENPAPMLIVIVKKDGVVSIKENA